MIQMRQRLCQEVVFFYLAILLLVISGSLASAQHMGAASPQMGEISSSQTGGGSPQMGQSPSSQSGGGSPQMGQSSSSQAGSGSPQMGQSSSSQAHGSDGLSKGGSNDANAASTHATAGDLDAGNADVAVQKWQGAATKNGESHNIRLNVVTIWTVAPVDARELLASNLSLEDMKSKLRASDKDVIFRGNMRFDNDSYQLTNISLLYSGNQSTLEASLAGPTAVSGSEDLTSIAGHIVVTILAEDEIEVAQGYVTINDSRYHGTYSLLLNEHLTRNRKGICSPEDCELFQEI